MKRPLPATPLAASATPDSSAHSSAHRSATRVLRAVSPRRLAGATVSAAAVVGLTAGCMVLSPVQTNQPYVPADGLPANVGDVALRDLLLVGGAGGPAVISGSAINEGGENVQVQVQQQAADGTTSGGSEIALTPRAQIDLSSQGLVLSKVDAKPGALATLRITATPGGTTIVTVPVLAATDYYATVTPAPTAPAPAPAQTPTATATTPTG